MYLNDVIDIGGLVFQRLEIGEVGLGFFVTLTGKAHAVHTELIVQFVHRRHQVVAVATMTNGGNVNDREESRRKPNLSQNQEEEDDELGTTKSSKKQYVRQKEQVQEGLNEGACNDGRKYGSHDVGGFSFDSIAV